MREILILDCPELQCPPVLVVVFKELCGAFARRGHQVKIARSLNEIHDNCIVFMGDSIKVENPVGLLAQYSTKAIYIGWYWHKQKDLDKLPYFIHTYENVLSNTLLADKVDMIGFMKEHKNSCPLLLRANEDPENIGKSLHENIYDYCFMGGRMCDWLVPYQEFKGFYYGVHDIGMYMGYEDRKKIYLASAFALGFQTDDNINNGHVSQRIYEGMAHGCIVLSHSLHASLQTEGIVEYVEPHREKIAERMRFLLKHPEYMKEKQQRGYDFVKRKGTNTYSIQLFIDTIKNVYGINV